MKDKSDLYPYLLVWAVAAAILVWKAWRNAGAGLVLSYCFQLFMLYWLGGLFHALPWSDLPDTDYVFLGFQQSTNGMIAFAAGSFAIGPWLKSKMLSGQSRRVVPNPQLPRLFIVIGVVFYFIVGPTLGRVAGFNAIGAVGSQMVVVGISLNCWRAWSTGGAKRLFQALAPAALLPVATLVVQGFLSWGVIALSTVVLFSAQFFRPRWLLFASGFIFGYVGLTGYTAYMRDRNDLRAVVWGGESVSNRFAAYQNTIETAEWFDWQKPEHLSFVDARLNQNTLVGDSVAYLANTGNFAHGSTLFEAFINMVPRVIWPSKPTAAGSFGLATKFTGIEFADGTSIGVGPVMELYGNFGEAGIWVGFFILGCLIQTMDLMAGFHLANGTWLEFANWYLVGISFLNVSGSFVECSAGAAASLVLARVIGKVLKRVGERKGTRQTVAPAPA